MLNRLGEGVERPISRICVATGEPEATDNDDTIRCIQVSMLPTPGTGVLFFVLALRAAANCFNEVDAEELGELVTRHAKALDRLAALGTELQRHPSP